MKRLLFGFCLFISLGVSSQVAAYDISGYASVIDGDTIVISGMRIRLNGIDAPDKTQNCKKNGTVWRCGLEAMQLMRALTRGLKVICKESAKDKYGRMVANCFAEKFNINAAMVESGMALAYRPVSTEYVPNEDKARLAGRGMWEGEFVHPWDWRKEMLLTEGLPAKTNGSSASNTNSFEKADIATASSNKRGWCLTRNMFGSVTGIVDKYQLNPNIKLTCKAAGGKFFVEKSEALKEQLIGNQKLESLSEKVWCATNESVNQTTGESCKNIGGEVFYLKKQAQDKHKYLRYQMAYVWCATPYAAERIMRSVCKSRNGMVVSSKSLAIAEHKRWKAALSQASWIVRVGVFLILDAAKAREILLKEAGFPTGIESSVLDGNTAYRVYVGPFESKVKAMKLERTIAAVTKDKVFVAEHHPTASPYSSTLPSSNQTAQTNSVQPSTVDKTVELEFWKSIEDSDDPEEYQIYLDEYPTGAFAKLAKSRINKFIGGTSTAAQSSIPNLNYGDYYALVIGNNQYKYLTDLRTAINDAQDLARVLEIDYGFDVTLLKNADRSQILRAISVLRSKAKDQDNVLIYYAGHGSLDKAADEGFWLPTDASRDPEDSSNWIATDRIVGQVRAMRAKHVMVVADSCFSGSITRGFKIQQRTSNWLETIVKKKSRTVLTSGGEEPVLDSGGGQNSVFAKPFLSILKANKGVLDASQLFSQLRPKVMVNSHQTPEYGNIHQAGHDGGDFLFVRR